MHPSRSRSNTDISLIICTRDRCEKLARCLESLRHIIFERPWELIIVDNGSTDDTAAVIREFIRSTRVQAVYLFEPKAGKSTGLNTALRVAQGQILAFTDDDCYPAPEFLSQVWSALTTRWSAT
jgi:glycosyltransferase involved in cell wall biosynthesis